MSFKDNISRFRLDEDNDIIDNKEVKVYCFNLQKDWEKLCILLNTLELQRSKAVNEKDNMVSVIKELYEEYNNYIDEYSMMKIDILTGIAEDLGVDLD